MAMIAAAPVAEAAAGRVAAGTAAKKAGGKATKKAAGTGAGRTPKPVPAGPAGGPPAPPKPVPADQAANDLLGEIPKAGRSVSQAVKSATLTPPRRLSGKDASGFMFGLVLYALALSAIKYGTAGPKGWLSAKFLNKVTLGPQQPPSAGGGGGGGGGGSW